MKKITLLSFMVVCAIVLLQDTVYSQGILAPGGTGAWGNMVYGGFALTSPQPYSRKNNTQETDVVAAFGVGLGNPVKGLGFQLGSNMLDVSEQDLYNFGVKVHRYFGKGISAGVGIENLFDFGTGTEDQSVNYASPYVAITKNCVYTAAPGTMLSKLSYSVGVGFGRFSKLSPSDEIEHDRKNGTYVFGGIQYKFWKRLSLHADWSGQNLTTGISINSFVEKIPFTIILAASDLTSYTGDGVRFVGAFGMAYQFADPNAGENKEQQIKDMFKANNEEMLYKINTVKDDLDKQIELLEKEIELLKKKQEEQKMQPQSTESEQTNEVGTASDDNDKVLNDKVKNYKGDEIVKVNAGDDSGNPADHGYYVVIHSFREKELAERAVGMEKDKGVTANIVYNKTRKWYYVYSHMYKNLKEALVKSTEQREKGYQGCWVHIY